MTIVKSPRVRIIIGRDIILMTGLTIILSSPKTTPAMAYSFIPPLKVNPATNQAATYNANALPNILTINLTILTVIRVAFLDNNFNYFDIRVRSDSIGVLCSLRGKLMRRAFWIYAVYVVLIVSGCAHFSGLKTKSWQKYENKKMGFEVRIPQDWSVVVDLPNYIRVSNVPTDKKGPGIPKEGMWVDIITEEKCVPDIRNDFYMTNYGIDKNKFLFQKFLCKGKFTVETCFWSSSSEAKEDKKLVESIADSLRAKP